MTDDLFRPLPGDWSRPFGAVFASHPGVECSACGAVVTNPRQHEMFHERLALMADLLAAVPPGQAKK